MNFKNLKIDEARVKELSYRNKERAKHLCAKAKAYSTDEEKEKRLSLHRCAYCFYFNSSGLAGQAFTEWNCGVCDKIQMNPNTAVPAVCNDCSNDHSLCVQCGCDLDMRLNRPATIK